MITELVGSEQARRHNSTDMRTLTEDEGPGVSLGSQYKTVELTQKVELQVEAEFPFCCLPCSGGGANGYNKL